MVINLNGHNLSCTGTTSLFRVDNGANLIVNGDGVIDTEGYFASANEGATVTINGGTFYCGWTCLQANGGKVFVKDGTFEVNKGNEGQGYTLNHVNAMKDVGLIEVTGGKFKNYDPSVSYGEQPPMNFVKEGYSSVKDGDYYKVVEGENVVSVSSDADLKAALTADVENISLYLASDVTYDVAAHNTDAMGGASTKSIVIEGNGKTITFNHTNSDWNNIVTNGGATLTINNAAITNAGKNNGPWNRHDLNFACNVVLNNVTSDKAMAFKAGATLINVTINDANTSDTYAIWIQPKGQTVTLDGCTIDMLACTDGRGIKIDNQYVSAADEAKVTLNVSNTVFKTEEKSAILVKSTKGADITLSNIDITEVAADSTNPVWVDDAAAAYADKVNVTGGTVIVEP